MLTQQEQVFFAILRSVLWGTPAAIAADTHWQGVLNLAARQKCLHAFSVWTKTQRIATPFDRSLQPTMFLTLQRQARLNHFATDVIALLSQNNIPATLIKGYSLSGLYPDPDMREFGDVDIYVGEKNYTRAAQIVTDAYPNAHWHSDIRGGIHFTLVLDENIDRVVELHRVTMEFPDKKANALYQAFTHKYLDNNTATVDIYGQSVSAPSAAYNALYVFMHAWHHFESTGVGFRQLGDWALCLHHAYQQSSPQAWEALSQEMDEILTALHMKTAWQTFGHLLVNELQLPVEAFPLYTERYQKRAKRLLRQMLRDGHGGRPVLYGGEKSSKSSNRSTRHDITLMSRFPWERPEKNRLLQRSYTFFRLLFDAWQMGKFFPDLAWHELTATLCGASKH